jgi:hypothetical protein
MYYVIFRWATGGIKFWAKCHFSYYILRIRSYCWSHEFFEILSRIGYNMHPPTFFGSPPVTHIQYSYSIHIVFFFIFFYNYRENRRVVPGSGIRFRYFIFEISGKPSFVEAVLWRVTQFFYLLCSQFRQKASGWINKTLLLIKQQKWLSEFCVKIDRVASKN